MEVRGPFNHILRPGLRRDFRDSYMGFKSEYNQLLKVGMMERAEEERTSLSGVPRQIKLRESEPFSMSDPVLSERLVYTDNQWGRGFGVSKELMEDDQYGKAGKSSTALGRATRLAQEYETADFFDDAFTGTYFKGYGKTQLINNAHTLLNSVDTWSNKIPGDTALGVTGMQAAFELAEGMVDHQGDPIVMKIDTLVINIKDQWTAMKITMGELEPFTDNNDINTIKRKASLNFVISHYKDQSGNDWFARDSSLCDSHFKFRVKPQFPDWYEDATRTAWFASRQRFLVYFYDPRGWIGSNAA